MNVKPEGPVIYELDESKQEFKLDEEIEDPISAYEVWTNMKYLGIPFNYVGFAIFDTAYASLAYPVFQNFLNKPQNYINVMGQMSTFFLALKICFGIFSDSVVICGQRRKPYIVIGWVGVFVVLLCNAIYVMVNEDMLYCYQGSLRLNETSNGECPPETTFQTISVGASFNPNMLAIFAIVGSFFFTLADVATDSYCVQLAKREPEDKRGQIQSYNMSLRFLFSLVFTLTSNLYFNSPMWGGDSSIQWAMSTYFWVLCFITGCGLPFWLMLHEDRIRDNERQSARDYFQKLWLLTKNHGYGSLLLFQFCTVVFSVGAVGASGLAKNWVGVTPILNTLTTTAQYVGVFLTIFAMGTWGRSKDWRMLNMIGLGVPPLLGLLTLVIVYDVNRSPAFWFFTQVDSQIISMVNWLAAIWAVNEMAPKGLEGTAYAFASTLHNAAIPLATTLRNNIGQAVAPLIVAGQFYEQDSESQYASNIYVTTGINMMALMFIVLFPRQKADARKRFAQWGSSAFMGIVVTSFALFGMCYPAIVNMITIFCTCMPIAGGPGCIPETCDAIY